MDGLPVSAVRGISLCESFPLNAGYCSGCRPCQRPGPLGQAGQAAAIAHWPADAVVDDLQDNHPIPTPEEALEPYLAAARLTNPRVRFVGVALNTSGLSEAAAGRVLKVTAESLKLPCVDPIRTGVDPVVGAPGVARAAPLARVVRAGRVCPFAVGSHASTLDLGRARE